MRPGWVPVAVLLICICYIHQTSGAPDIYLEGEEDASNEFLEVKEEDIWEQGHKKLKRLKRDFLDLFSWGTPSTTTEAPVDEDVTEDPDVENVPDDLEHGSGQPDRTIPEPDLGEKTLRVSFVVMEPYQDEYNRRDSPQFQNFSSSLANEVNRLYESLPGSQRATLVRIQSRVSDEFSCKVTLDITTTGFDNTDRITQLLQDHIRNNRRLGDIEVSDADFSAYLTDSSVVKCSADEIKCDDLRCVPGSARCNGVRDCPDGADEEGCSFGTSFDQEQTNQNLIPGYDCERKLACSSSSVTYCEEQRCDGRSDCPEGDDEQNCPSDVVDIESTTISRGDNPTTPRPYQACPEGEFSCDETRCVRYDARCDGYNDCTDGTDEAGCGSQTCGADDFRCGNGMCIAASKRCDRIANCPLGEDEKGCDCVDGDFRCVSDGTCIEMTKRCDGHSNCKDGSDELNCSTGKFRCRNGKIISDSLRCNRRYDCLPGDYSDEQNCPAPNCPPDGFTCDTGSSVACATRCDGRAECDGGEDEEQCDVCSHECDGICVDDANICNGVPDCTDGSDELNCDQCDGPTDFRCTSGECINSSQFCNGISECDDESDELDCNITMISKPDCNSNEFRCRDGTCISNQFFCDNQEDCNDGSDEENCRCDEQSWQCPDGQCISKSAYCDGRADCQNGADEANCNWITTSGAGLLPAATTAPTTYSPQTQSPWGVNGNNLDGNNGGYPTYRPPDNGPTTENYYGRPEYGQPGAGEGGDRYPNYRPEGPSPNRPGSESGYSRPGGYPSSGVNSGWSYPGSNIIPESTGPVALNLRTYPSEQGVRNAIFGGDVVFQCRDEGPKRAPVRWIREGGRPIRPGYTDRNGRLEINGVRPTDSGVYICQASAYLGQRGSELRVTLKVDARSEPTIPHSISCMPHEATCGNGQCIPKSAVCNGKIDCKDGSDEEACFMDGKCDPNQYQCENNKCILKTWICDSDDDCGDGSDERNCGSAPPGECQPTEFTCASGDQCIPRSFHCDSQNDCIDGSDEIGCAKVHITRPPLPSNVLLNVGDTLILNCSATGIPKPLISWRRNWGVVPDVCVMENSDNNGQVVGTLTCPKMQPEYNGAYSCEAMNNEGTSFAQPDAIVFVNRTDVCPPGYFNRDARSERDCIKCFCFGESTVCHSADLFTFNMPTPLGGGGTRLVGVTNPEDGKGQQSLESISDQFYYLPVRNGASINKVQQYNTNWAWSKTLPYLTLPDSYNGNQLTSYGGHIRYKISPHRAMFEIDNSVPDIIIKGKYRNLVHFARGSQRNIEARLTPENWQTPSSRGLVPATREDIMMTLDNIEVVLLRGSINNAGVNITDFVMESAQSFDIGFGPASLVEECTCPPGYEGLSCQKCASGYTRYDNGPWLGDCKPIRRDCPDGMYGDPASGYACRPCPCPLTNPENQFARTCHIGSRGNVICNCAQGYEGDNCDRCADGYTGNPLAIGDSCKAVPTNRCNPTGTANVRMHDECVCKDNVQGRYCDECKAGSFFLSEDFSQGCALCFCSGVSQECSSGGLRRKTTSVHFNTPALVNQVRVYDSTPLGGSGYARYNAPVETNLTATLVRGEITLTNLDRNRPAIYYWSLPVSFAGDKVTSYGGYLRYSLNHVPGAYSAKNNAADVQLISENHLTFHYFGNFKPSSDETLEASVQFLEKGWQRQDGKGVSREHFLLALADVKAILVKATYASNSEVASLVSASIDVAEPDGYGPSALHVEQCVCPTGYIGTSCEDCALGFTRNGSGLYLEHCGRCECNGHSNICHAETGVCRDCQDNTAGESCEECKPGYTRDSAKNCVPSFVACDPRGTETTNGDYCVCKPNVEGSNCDSCRPGTYGLSANNPLGCFSCYCSGVTSDCHEASQYIRIPLPAPMLGDDYGGYRLTNLNADRVLDDHINSVPTNSELMYVFDSFSPIDEELYWSLPVFPGNRVLSYGGTIQLKQTFESQSSSVSEPGTDVLLIGDETLYWTNPQPIRAGEPKSYQVPLTEKGWFLLNTNTPARRSDLMSVLRNLKRVLVRATLVRDISSTSIADVSMDIVSDTYDPNFPRAEGIEVCMCPEGYIGTSCESCSSGFYHDEHHHCQRCQCNGHDCHLDASGQVQCDCRPPYTGNDCSLHGDNRYQPPNTSARPPPPQSSVVVQITSPTIKIQEVGGSVTFTCQAQSRMTQENLLVDWYKKGGELPLERTFIDKNQGRLTITNVQVSDSGVYTCLTSDGFSTGEDYATLKVPVNPMTFPNVVIRPPGLREYFENDRVELDCVATGNPQPTISWKRSGNRALPMTAQLVDTRLVIENVQQEDNGEYICVATNPLGPVDSIAIVNVKPRPSAPRRERLSVTPSSPTVNEGSSIRVTCTGSTNVPAGTIDWIRKDRAEFPTNVRSDNGVLYIDYARLENQGVYVCQTSSYNAEPVLVVIAVNPQGPTPQDQRPNITIPTERLSIPTGGSGTIDCLPRGYPLPLVRWSKHEGTFGPGTSQLRDQLIISNARDDDQGYYACEGSVDGRPIGKIYVYVEIERREAPVVEIWPPDEQAVTLNSPFELRCRVLAGIPEPAVVWSRQERALGTHVTMLPNHILRFDHIEVNDEGTYVCSATNDAGTSTASTVVKVRSPPEITITPQNYIKAVNGDSIKIECRASGYPQPYVSIKKGDGGFREIVPATEGIAVLHIPSVSTRDEGNYVCSASSPAGSTEEQFAIEVTRGDGGGFDDEGSGEPEIDPNPYPDPYPNPYPNPSDEQPRELLAIEGHDSVIGCDAPDTYEVQWTRADGPLQPSARQVGKELIIINATKADSGPYVCNMMDRYTNALQRSAYTRLLVIGAPRIVLQPPTQTVHPGESPTVECVVHGDEIQEIIWRPVTRSFSSRVEIRGSVLIFNRIEVEDAGTYECFAKNRVANASASAEVIVSGPPDEPQKLIQIERTRNKPYRVGEDVEVNCRALTSDVTHVFWERTDTKQFLPPREYGGGAMLILNSVQVGDAGVYRCIGEVRYGRTVYEDFNLEVQRGNAPARPDNGNRPEIVQYTAQLGDTIDMPCIHNLEEPDRVEWRRDYSPLQPQVNPNAQNLHLEHVSESDAGTYICRVNSRRGRPVESRAILKVTGIVPHFDSTGWIALPSLKDAYNKFDIQISFKPLDGNGLILYSSQKQDRYGDYLALHLVDGVPKLVADPDGANGDTLLSVTGDRPLQLNTWHTIRLSKTSSKMSMDVDNNGPVHMPYSGWELLELNYPLYIGGVPDYDQLPAELAGTSGFIGCVSMLVLGREEKNIMLDSIERNNVQNCDSCSPNRCFENGVCQEARNERGYVCICAAGYAGVNCDRTGEACRPGLCGPGKCTYTVDGYKCSCPVTFTGKHCETKRSIEYPAFTGSAYLAIDDPSQERFNRMSLKVKAAAPVSDGIIMYRAESSRGHGGYTALTVHNGRLEFTYDLGDGSRPVRLTSERPLPANEWIDVTILRHIQNHTLMIGNDEVITGALEVNHSLALNTPMFVGGVDDLTITLNPNIGVITGFNGCIKEVKKFGGTLDIVGKSIQSANVQECSHYDRGDIPEAENLCSQCRHGGQCSPDGTGCICPPGYTGQYCEYHVPFTSHRPNQPCDARPCRNGGTCRMDYSNRMNFTCECPLGYAGASCQMTLDLLQSVGFLGNGYLELPSWMLRYDNLDREPALVALAFYTRNDGVLVYQHEVRSPNHGDYILIRVDNGVVVLDWDLGGGQSSINIPNVYVADGDRHSIIAQLYADSSISLNVDGETRNGTYGGFTGVMSADSNVYIGGIPEGLNFNRYPGLNGCLEQIEFTGMDRGVNLGHEAVAGRNPQRCRK